MTDDENGESMEPMEEVPLVVMGGAWGGGASESERLVRG